MSADPISSTPQGTSSAASSRESSRNRKHRGDKSEQKESANEKLDTGDITLIAFINFNSGGKMGQSLSTKLVGVLGEDRVFNLGDGGPKKGLLAHRASKNLRVAVAGGDGTINWVLSMIRALEIRPYPPVGLLPLGTGNDTARAFGW